MNQAYEFKCLGYMVNYRSTEKVECESKVMYERSLDCLSVKWKYVKKLKTFLKLKTFYHSELYLKNGSTHNIKNPSGPIYYINSIGNMFLKHLSS